MFQLPLCRPVARRTLLQAASHKACSTLLSAYFRKLAPARIQYCRYIHHRKNIGSKSLSRCGVLIHTHGLYHLHLHRIVHGMQRIVLHALRSKGLRKPATYTSCFPRWLQELPHWLYSPSPTTIYKILSPSCKLHRSCRIWPTTTWKSFLWESGLFIFIITTRISYVHWVIH